ncbi:hypothetical protein M2145_001007 [Lachnospiraceae bacterium PF1-21]|uniref:SHOCT domain-containing protein n=1 Tax=Ohessyouella blattaphilus TaxID=2949333 RepID=UPI003E21B135
MELLKGIGLLCLAVGCFYVLYKWIDHDNKKEEEEKRNKEAKVRYNSQRLDDVLEKHEQVVSIRYKNTIIAKDNSTEKRSISELSFYSPDTGTSVPPQKVDIWVDGEALCLLTNKAWLLRKMKEQKENVAERIWWKFDKLKTDLEIAYTTEEQYQVHAFKLCIPEIEYFTTDGDIYTSTNISGGGGVVGGSSLKGAVVGGVIAGDVGAVIGSRKESVIQGVRSNTTVHDEKFLVIKYKDEQGKLCELKVTKGYARLNDILKDLIPEKELTYVLKSGNKETMETNITIKEKLINLQELYDSKLISQDEFESKRATILRSL